MNEFKPFEGKSGLRAPVGSSRTIFPAFPLAQLAPAAIHMSTAKPCSRPKIRSHAASPAARAPRAAISPPRRQAA
jgi:hypothetical protein